MSGYILCQTKKAEKPYFVENISTNIYSLEELCYYLYHNLYLVDSSVMNEGLCIWISEELDLPRLAAKLRPHLGKFASIEDVNYKAGSMTLDVGDLIFQYTDGVTEATNVENQLYGMERLEQVLNRVKDRTPSEILPEVKKDIDAFVGEAPQFDDITMLCVEYKAKMEKA